MTEGNAFPIEIEFTQSTVDEDKITGTLKWAYKNNCAVTVTQPFENVSYDAWTSAATPIGSGPSPTFDEM